MNTSHKGGFEDVQAHNRFRTPPLSVILATLLLLWTTLANAQQPPAITLINGDADGDNEVTLFDYGILVANFGLTEEDPNFNPEADLDGDTEVTLFDFGILVNNFGQIGVDALTGVEQPMEEGLAVPVRLQLGHWDGHPNRMIQVEFRAKAVGTESNPTAPVYVKTVGIVAPSAEVEVELTLPAGAYTVQAKASHWLRSEITDVISAFRVSTGAGNGCSLLNWSLEEIAQASGYRIYRSVQEGDEVLLTAVPLVDEMYADTGLSNGLTYRYRIVALNDAQQPIAYSSWMSVTPTASAPLLIWTFVPSTVTGNAEVRARLSNGNVPAGVVVFVDDHIAGSAGLSPSVPGDISGTFDSTEFSNGTHMVKLAGFAGDYVAVTPVATTNFSNPISAFNVRDVFEASENVPIGAVLPTDTATWQLDVLKLLDDTIVRSYIGTGNTISLAWDGRNNLGQAVENDCYIVRVTATDAQGRTYQHRKPTAKVPGFPNGLALISTSSGAHAHCMQLARSVANAFKIMRQRESWFDFVILPLQGSASQQLKDKIWNWLRHTVTVFYLYGHGTGRVGPYPPVAYWGSINFWSEMPNDRIVKGSILRDPTLKRRLHFIVPEITNGRQYTFAFIDACNSAAAHFDENPRMSDDAFAEAFNVGTNVNYSSCFVGWNGNCVMVTLEDGNPSIWLQWRERFWNLLANGYYVSQAYSLTCQRTPQEPGKNPHDPGRFAQWEDTKVP